MRNLPLLAILGATFWLGAPPVVQANDFEPKIREVFEQKLKQWLSDPVLVAAIKAQNATTAKLTDAEIEAMDQDWRAQAQSGSGPLLSQLMQNQASSLLRQKKEGSGGLVTEVFAMDSRGLNVAQSDVTSDYMQGDEPKWQKTYPVGANSLFIDEVEFDDSTSSFQCQISATVADPATGEPIGAVTFGLSLDQLS
jgi:hypothetical protein